MNLGGVEHHIHSWEATGGSLPLIALHGFTGLGSDFAPIAQRLGGTIVAPDLVGHGATGVPTHPWSMKQVVESVQGIVEKLGWKRYGILGYSMGGRIGFSLAATQPKGLSALIGVGVSPGIAGSGERQERSLEDSRLADRILSIGVTDFLEEWSCLPLIRTQASIPGPWRRSMEMARRQHNAEGLATSLRGHGTGCMPPLWDRLSEIDVPTLLVAGEQDTKFVALGRQVVRELVDGELQVMPGVGHCAHLEDLDSFVERLQSFLKVVEKKE